MFKNPLTLILCLTAVFLIVEAQSRMCSKAIPESYLVTDQITYSYVTKEGDGLHSHKQLKVITRVAMVCTLNTKQLHECVS
uniref:SFRICE_034571 n=1 Tax=Spodoptera frugiperda TaxID=7108 RepID=A0A2H1WM75_SPOFR